MSTEFMRKVISIESGRKAASVPQKMNDFMDQEDDGPSLEPLFDAFWREGEVALLFGPSGSGKSIFAVQIAESLARGRVIDGFAMPASGRRVLYVDLQHADFQFRLRYRDLSGRKYTFSERLCRVRPPADEKDFVSWLRTTQAEGRFDILVIDDIDALKTSCDGTRETLTVMRELRRLRDETMVSILVVAGSGEARGRQVSETDLGRSRALCSAADSVFALSPWRTGECRVAQTRSRNAPVVWTPQTAPVARLLRLTGGMLGFQFDERFVPELTPEENDLVDEIKSMKEVGMSFRSMANELGMSKSSVYRLWQKFIRIRRLKELGQEVEARLRRQAMFGRDDDEYFEREAVVVDDSFPGCDEYDEARKDPRFEAINEDEDSPDAAQLITEFYNIGLARSLAKKEYEQNGLAPSLTEMMEHLDTRGTRSPAPALDLITSDSVKVQKPKTIYDLPLVIDRYGRKMYVEKEEHHTGRPEIFYTVNARSGQILRYVRRGFGVFGTVMKDASLLEK